ncbi:hypothetical protein [Aliikangiella sp. IMCC44359]|uniref:hypothetical protein n=1 Tax=Aliikangiella sp. IMCC44359 TaxID=3459125 RepID=UPI00403AE3C6
MKYIVLILVLLPNLALAEKSDYWSTNKTMNLPKGVATTACSFYNNLDQSSDQTKLMNEIYSRWLRGWVSSFAMYSDWDIRDIEETEYLQFIQSYCKEFPNNIIGMAAHAFTFKVKR